MLFLDHSDLVIELPAKRRGVQISNIHIKIHCLLFRSRNDVDVQLCLQIIEITVDIEPHVVIRMTILCHSGTPRHDLGVFSDELSGISALFELHEIGIPIEMVKIFQQRKIKLFFDIGILFTESKIGGKIDCELLITDGVFENALIGRLE